MEASHLFLLPFFLQVQPRDGLRILQAISATLQCLGNSICCPTRTPGMQTGESSELHTSSSQLCDGRRSMAPMLGLARECALMSEILANAPVS